MTDIDPTAIMAAHSPYYWSGPDGSKTCEAGVCHDASWPCEPYRLAEALAASEAKVARVQEVVDDWYDTADDGGYVQVKFISAALADQPKQAS